MRDDVFTFLLSLPGRVLLGVDLLRRRLADARARTLDMMVLVAVANRHGLALQRRVTLTGGGEVFYEAAAMLTTLCCWDIGSRCGPGGGRAIRTLLELAPPGWRWSSVMVNRWRCPPPRWWSATCC